MALDFDDRSRQPDEPGQTDETASFGSLSDAHDDPPPTEALQPVESAPQAEPEPEPEPEPDPEATPYETVEHQLPATTAASDQGPDLDALRDATFPVVWRGYDVQAVDAYVAEVEELLARVEERTTPTVAVQRALDRVGEQTAAILRQAEQSADETTRASRAKADDRLQRAEHESQELHAAALARVRALDDDVERLWQERQRLVDATKELADRLRTVADDAESRFPPAAAPPEKPPGDAPGADADPGDAPPAP